MQKVFDKFREAESNRRPYESVFADLTKYFSPYRDDFIGGSPRYNSTNRTPRRDLFDTEGANAAEQLVSTICGGLINYADPWFSLTSTNPFIMEDIPSRRFLESAGTIIQNEINKTSANFYSNAHEFLSDLVIYGNAALYVTEGDDNDGLKFVSIPFGEVFFTEDHNRQINSVFRSFQMTNEQILLRWPNINAESRNKLESRPQGTSLICHAVLDKSIGVSTDKNKNFASVYFMVDGHEVLSQGGYHEMPYIVTRWARRSGDVYGRSPAWTALPDVKQANAIRKTMLETAERMGNPPILMSDDGVLTQVRLIPGQPVIGGLDSITQSPRLQPMMVGGNLPVTQQLLELTHQNIRDRFFIGSLNNYNPNVEKTATEIIEFRREESRLMGPQIGKIQSEMLEPILIRCRNILQRQKKFEPLPEVLAGIEIKINYSSPLSNLQRYSDIEAIQRTVQSVLPFLQIDPGLMDNFDTDRTFQHIAQVNGVPAAIIRSTDEVAQLRAQREQAQQAAQMAQGLEQLSNANVNFAKAESLNNQVQG